MRDDYLKTLLGSVTVLVITGLVYLSAFYYEKAYLLALNVPDKLVSEVAEVRLFTYVSLLTAIVTISSILAGIVGLTYKSKKIKKVFKSQGSLIIILSLIALLIIRTLLIHQLGFSEDSGLITVFNIILSLTLIINAFYYVAENVSAKDLKFIQDKKNSSLSRILVTLIGVYFIYTAFTWMSGAFGTFMAEFNKPLGQIKVNNKTYNLIRDYGDKLIVESTDQKQYFVLSDVKQIELKQ